MARGTVPSREGGGVDDYCDYCGEYVAERASWHGRAPDSSYLDPRDRWQDGWRPLVACSDAHLRAAVSTLRARPFVEAELWAERLVRIRTSHPRGIGLADLERESRLTSGQVVEAALWAGRRHTRYRKEGVGSSEPTPSSGGEPGKGPHGTSKTGKSPPRGGGAS